MHIVLSTKIDFINEFNISFNDLYYTTFSLEEIKRKIKLIYLKNLILYFYLIAIVFI